MDGLKASLEASRVWKIAAKQKVWIQSKSRTPVSRDHRDWNKTHLGAGFGQASSASRPWKLEQDKKGPFFLSSNRNKKQALKNLASPVQDSSRSCAGEISFNLKQTFQQICHSEGAKTGPSRGPLLISRGSTF